ncbi:MAG: CAP domain-containing protein, partial [Deltaproteobacteria bacterium]|nr:CAP domain-containing protein [Deltaproteobacteria bacterium]
MKKIWIAFVFLSLFTVKGLAAEEIKEVVIFEKLSKKEKTILLGEHNRVRADIGVKALEWSDELSRYVEQWANYLAENLCVLRHRPSSGKWKRKYGENLFMCV